MEQLGITVFDVAVIAVAVFGAVIGMSTGFAHAVLFIASWIGAGWVAWRFSKVVQPEVEKLVGSTELAYFISMLAVFVAALIVLIMLTSVLSRSIRSRARSASPTRSWVRASACSAPGSPWARPSCSTATWVPGSCRPPSREQRVSR